MPRARADACLDALHGIGPAIRGALQVFEMRTIAADDLWLSPALGRDSVAAHFTWHPAPELVAPALDLVESTLAGFDPRPHWGKVFSGWDRDRLGRPTPTSRGSAPSATGTTRSDTSGTTSWDACSGPEAGAVDLRV